MSSDLLELKHWIEGKIVELQKEEQEDGDWWDSNEYAQWEAEKDTFNYVLARIEKVDQPAREAYV